MNLFNELTACAMDKTFTQAAETNAIFQNPSYSANRDHILIHYKEIAQNLNERDRLILRKLMDLYSDQLAITEDMVYRQGFADGMQFLTSGLTWTAKGAVRKC